MRAIDLAKLREVKPDHFYQIRDVAAMLSASYCSVLRAVKAGRLVTVADPLNGRQRLIPGVSILAAAAPLLSASSVKLETKAERIARGAAARAAIDRIK